jgi:hypothetical protein
MSQVQVGDYSVFGEGPDSWIQTSAPVGNLHVNTDIQFHNLNFGFRSSSPTVPDKASAPIAVSTSSLDASKLIDGNVFSEALLTNA